MITSRQLRAGNYLHCINGQNGYGDSDAPIHGVFVGELASQEFLNRPDLSKRWEYILLTEAWLERMGFEMQDPQIDDAPGDGWRGIRLAHHTLQITISTDCHMVNIVDESGNSVLFRKFLGFQYVHQLQNLYYALSGEELSIKPI